MTEKKEKTIEISSLTLNIGSREIALSIDEARKLKAALDNLFKTETVHHWHYDYFKKVEPRPWWETTISSAALNLPLNAAATIEPKYSLNCNVNELLEQYTNPRSEP